MISAAAWRGPSWHKVTRSSYQHLSEPRRRLLHIGKSHIASSGLSILSFLCFHSLQLSSNFHSTPIYALLCKQIQAMASSHSHDGHSGHSHDAPGADHGHTHEILDGPGSYMGREMPLIEGRNWNDRAFTVGIGGYVHPHLLLRVRLGSRNGVKTHFIWSTYCIFRHCFGRPTTFYSH